MKTFLNYCIVVSVLFLCSCGSSPEYFPEIESVSPEEGSSRAALIQEISVTFSIDIDPSSITQQTFLLRDEDNSIVDASVSYDESTRTARLLPEKSLWKNTVYTARLSAEIRDRSSKVLGRDFSWSFRTSGFLFAVISDPHIRIPGNPDNDFYDNAQNISNLEQTVALINERYSSADFVVVTGDAVGCLFSSNPESYGMGRDTPADRFKTTMDKLSMPYHLALGNHDYEVGFNPDYGEGVNASDTQIPSVEAVWERLLNAPPYYSFEHEGFRFYILNSVTGMKRRTLCLGEEIERMCMGSFTDGQMNWFENELEQGEKSFLFFHHPIFTGDTQAADWALPADWYMVYRYDRFYNILGTHADQILGIFVGHGHYAAEGHIGAGAAVYETPATGDFFGRANHINLVSVIPGTGEISVSAVTPFTRPF